MMLETGLVTPAEKRGFCRRIALNSVDPDRGSPEIRWSAGKTAVRIFRRSTELEWIEGLRDVKDAFKSLTEG